MNNIPAGYKQSEVGMIPEDWSLVPLGQLITSVEYGSSAKSNAQGKIPVLRMGNLQGGKIDWNDLVYTSDVVETRKYALKSGDVLFNRTNTIDLVGKTSIYNGEQPAIFAGYLIRINADKSLLDSKFLNYILNTEFSRKHSAKVLSLAVGQANINGQKLKTYPIPLPPLSEQHAIAEALADTDALIESLEQLIAKKRQIKQGAMQELLTGQKRLPGFSGEWEVKPLGDAIDALEAGVSVNSVDDESGEKFILKTSAVANGTFVPAECKTIAPQDVHRACLNPRNDTIIISRMNTPDLVGECGYVDKDYPNLFLPDRLWMTRYNRSSGINGRWLSYLLSTPEYKQQIKAAATGTSGSMKNLSKTALLSLHVNYPAPAEQTAIATILSDMDAEIATLETRLAKTRQLKQGMMHNLLTGRIRLV